MARNAFRILAAFALITLAGYCPATAFILGLMGIALAVNWLERLIWA